MSRMEPMHKSHVILHILRRRRSQIMFFIDDPRQKTHGGMRSVGHRDHKEITRGGFLGVAKVDAKTVVIFKHEIYTKALIDKFLFRRVNIGNSATPFTPSSQLKSRGTMGVTFKNEQSFALFSSLECWPCAL